MKNSVLVSLAHIATVIGAGFASGAEVVSYFLIYGRASLFGVVLAGILFSAFSYLVMNGCFENKTYDFLEYVRRIMPVFWQRFTVGIFFLSMVVCLGAMSAAAGEILGDCFLVNKTYAAVAFSLVCGILLCFPVSYITKFNGALGGVIGVGIIFCCVYIMKFRFLETFNSMHKISLSALSYVAYNGMGASVLLCSMSKFLKTKKQIISAALFNGIGITIILILLWCVVGIYYGKIDLGEIPMLVIAKRQGKVIFTVYAVLLFLAVFTTAVSNGYGVIELVKKTRFGNWAVMITLTVMIILSKIGFFTIVNVVYRGCGYISLIFPIFMIINRVKLRNLKKNKDKQI